MRRDEDAWYVYQWVGGKKWVLKDRTMNDSLGLNLFSIRCQQWRDARVVLMHGDNIVAERGVSDDNLAYPVMP